MTTTSGDLIASGRDRPASLTRADLAALYAEHRLGLVRLAVLLVDDRSTAEDVVQDAFAGLAAHAGRLRDADAALGYLRRAVVNRSRSALRRRRTVRGHRPPHDVPGGDPADRVVLDEEHRAVLAALDRLPRRQREVIVLRYWCGLSEAGIAETLAISRGTVKSTAARALAAVERHLQEGTDR